MSYLKKGVYRLFGDMRASDEEFKNVYEAAKRDGSVPKPANKVAVAIADSGIYTSEYFEAHLVAGGDFTNPSYSMPRLTAGKPKTTGVHGSHVGSIACFGASQIELIDVQVCSTQESGANDPRVWANALSWAAGRRPFAINCSVMAPWEEASVRSIVKNNTGVLFVASGGNSHMEFTSDKRGEDSALSSRNTILVSGCDRDGAVVSERGYGEGIDVYAPSVGVPGLAAEAVKRAKHEARERQRREQWERERKDMQSGASKEEIAELEKQLLTAEGMRKHFIANKLKRAKASLTNAPDFTPVPFEYKEALNDNGSSFALPMVSNVAAKLFLICPKVSPADAVSIIRSTARDNGGRLIMDPTAAYEAAMRYRSARSLREALA